MGRNCRQKGFESGPNCRASQKTAVLPIKKACSPITPGISSYQLNSTTKSTQRSRLASRALDGRLGWLGLSNKIRQVPSTPSGIRSMPFFYCPP
jgi:hypothetical protein